MRQPLLTVAYSGEPDVVFEFSDDGQSRRFGRDDVVCEIVIWSALNGSALSRVAGRIWRMDGELWLRNLSGRHELHLQMPGMPPEQPLRPRRDPQARGEARSIPGSLCTVSAPEGCELQVRQIREPDPQVLDFGLPDPTVSAVPPVPAALMPIAAALCEPLLRGAYLPASYRAVMARTGEPSLKTVRRLVGELCQYYTETAPALHHRVVERMLREQRQLGIAQDPQLRHGIWTFGQPSEGGRSEDYELARRRALALPEYYEVARMLVSHYRVTTADVQGVLPPRFDRG